MAHRITTPLLALTCLALVACGGGGGGGTMDTTPSAPTFFVTDLGASGPGTLADVMAAAPEGAIIRMSAGLNGTITPGAELVIDKSVSILGSSGDTVSVSGGTTNRVFDVVTGVTVEMADFRVIDGGGVSGAGIRNQGTLILANMTIQDCVTGGAARGGGIQNFGTLTIRDSLIQGCSASNGGGFANDGGTMLMERCLVFQNQTSGNSGGGGTNGEGTLTIVNSHFEGNFTTGSGRPGGAILSGANTPTQDTILIILQSTIVGNTATGSGGGIGLFGVGSMNYITLMGSIVAGNTSGGVGPDMDLGGANITNAFYNLIGDGADSGLTHLANNNFVGTSGAPIDPLLGALQDNGGPTLSRVPMAGSTAIDSMPPGACRDPEGDPLTTDQRGLDRPAQSGCDRGAVEVQ